MSGLSRICKMYGRMEVKDASGKSAMWLWDYAKDKARLEKEFTKDEMAASEKAKWSIIKDQISK